MSLSWTPDSLHGERGLDGPHRLPQALWRRRLWAGALRPVRHRRRRGLGPGDGVRAVQPAGAGSADALEASPWLTSSPPTTAGRSPIPAPATTPGATSSTPISTASTPRSEPSPTAQKGRQGRQGRRGRRAPLALSLARRDLQGRQERPGRRAIPALPCRRPRPSRATGANRCFRQCWKLGAAWHRQPHLRPDAYDPAWNDCFRHGARFAPGRAIVVG